MIYEIKKYNKIVNMFHKKPKNSKMQKCLNKLRVAWKGSC